MKTKTQKKTNSNKCKIAPLNIASTEQESVIVQINYGPDKKLRSIWKYMVPKKEHMRKNHIPCWLIGTFCFLLASLLIVFGAAMYLKSVKRPGVYTESCVGRSCINGFGLKCISGICDCNSNQFYQKGCRPKLNYTEQCMSNTNFCADDQNLVCRDGVCKCDSTMFWSGKQCSSKSSFSSSCYNEDQCLAETKLTCDLNRKLCVCPSNRFWDGSSCFLLKTINEFCSSNLQCSTSKNLYCLNAYCQCLSTMYWNGLNCVLSTTTTSTTSTTTTSTSTTTTTSTTSTTTTVVTVQLYGQCGGLSHTGSTVCDSTTQCYIQNIYYSQCLTACPSGWSCSSG